VGREEEGWEKGGRREGEGRDRGSKRQTRGEDEVLGTWTDDGLGKECPIFFCHHL
jgi:hypothetical protein